ncbi:Aste57867_21540 [Aphanomyces stellatus]|uniref:Elicitin n=1 Tax=Aphanomyces stellatus TaxID=120398 RepID=A0A485LHR9_9STRA|nr:hypothetical protein As57867_021471 [Aphanomyces stellatus]VFT98210.1 Aste57867_21540 [Aphanomyces stellatus]
MKGCLIFLVAAVAVAQDVPCDYGAISKAFGPIVGDLNECMTASGYKFLPAPTTRPTQAQLDLFCSLPECDKAATSYAGIALPKCQFVLDSQVVPTTDFFSTLCPKYQGRTARPTTTVTPAPTNATQAPTTAAPTTMAPAAKSISTGLQLSTFAMTAAIAAALR